MAKLEDYLGKDDDFPSIRSRAQSDSVEKKHVIMARESSSLSSYSGISSALKSDYTGYIAVALAILIGWGFGKYGERILNYFKPENLDNDAARKLSAKRVNEHVKLFGTFCNTVGAAVIGTALIVPYIGQPDGILGPNSYLWGMAGLAVHAVGQACLRLMKSES